MSTTPRLGALDASPPKSSMFLHHYRQQQSIFRDEAAGRHLLEEQEGIARREILQGMVKALMSTTQQAVAPLATRGGLGPSAAIESLLSRSPQTSFALDVSPTPLTLSFGYPPAGNSPSHNNYYQQPPQEQAIYAPPLVPTSAPLGPPIVSKLARLGLSRKPTTARELFGEEAEERKLLRAKENQRWSLLAEAIRCEHQLMVYDALDDELGGQKKRKKNKQRATGDMSLDADQLYPMMERKDIDMLGVCGGIEGIILALNTDTDSGIEESSVAQRRERYGKNELPEAEQNTFWDYVKDALGDKMMRALIVAACMSLLLGLTVPDPETGKVDYATGWIEGAAILVSVAVVTLVSASNDYQKAKKFAQLSAETAKREVALLRDGKKVRIDSTLVVVGDIMYIEGGDILTADGLYLDGQDVKCDESSATGEPDAIAKDSTNDPFMLSGTSVLEGQGRILITGVGPNSFSGHHTLLTRAGGDNPTPLQERLEEMADQIGVLGMGAAAMTFGALALKASYFMYTGRQPWAIKPFLDFVIVAVTIVVVAIPEGLPLAVTIALAYSMRNMMRDNCLVRILAACETMGGANTICSDKTGTLTTNRMTVVQAWLMGRTHRESRPLDFDEALPHAARLKLADAICLNTTADEKETPEGMVWVGNKTEYALLQFVRDRLGFDFNRLRNLVPKEDRNIYVFNSEKKRMTSLVRRHGAMMLYVKGAPEYLLPQCDHYLNPKGERELIDETRRRYFSSVITDMSSSGNRTLLVAYAELDSLSFPASEPGDEVLTLIAIFGIQDPIRDEVPLAVQQCQQAGICIRMVTGDNRNTAISIAKQCGVLTSTGLVLEGREFRELAEKHEAKLVEMLPRLQVLARSSPTDKHTLVSLLRKHDDIVAVTGDGTNDSPALKEAHVGFAMKSGTEIAKSASDIVLLDDNFASVVNAAMWGRNVNDNIRKFIQFQVTVNIVGVALTFVGALIDGKNHVPLSPVQLLWLNLIMDTLAALALATEQPSKELLNRPPFPKSAPLISRRMWVNIIGQACLQLCVMSYLLTRGFPVFAPPLHSPKHSTMFFNTFIMMQVWNEFNARKLYNEVNVFSGLFTRSKGHLLVLLVMLGFQFFAVQVAGHFMNTVPLNLVEWLVTIAIGASCIPAGFVLRSIPVKEAHFATSATALAPQKTTGKERFRKGARRMTLVVRAARSLCKKAGVQYVVPPPRGGKRLHA
eukprot:TRINITY_DN11083_c0_g1_i1.p1 TRINITY_DN11083_c0_g1~~TRINITY_DN11083_c0_g1_i1.p1  ORF type:complete len:1224 (+),score=220.52 TRINITY_DN11083_c0_g1_i1:41-3673(+)